MSDVLFCIYYRTTHYMVYAQNPMSILFVSKSNIFSVKNKKGGDYSNLAIINDLSKKFTIDILFSDNVNDTKLPQFIKNKFKCSGLNTTFNIFLIVFKTFNMKFENSYSYILAPKGSLVYSYFLSIFNNIPLVICVRDFHELPLLGPCYGKTSIKDLIKICFFYFLWRRIYHKSHLVITNSQFLKNTILKYYSKTNVEVLFPSVKITNKKYYPSKHKPIGLISGTVHKGEDVLLSISLKLPQLNFIIYNSTMELCFPANVKCVGYTNRDEIFSNISLLLVPSTSYETFGRIVVESQLRGIPCLCHGIGGLKESQIIEDYIIPFNDINNWVNKINYVLENYNYCRNLLTSKYENYTSDIHIKKLRKIFN